MPTAACSGPIGPAIKRAKRGRDRFIGSDHSAETALDYQPKLFALFPTQPHHHLDPLDFHFVRNMRKRIDCHAIFGKIDDGLVI